MIFSVLLTILASGMLFVPDGGRRSCMSVEGRNTFIGVGRRDRFGVVLTGIDGCVLHTLLLPHHRLMLLGHHVVNVATVSGVASAVHLHLHHRSDDLHVVRSRYELILVLYHLHLLMLVLMLVLLLLLHDVHLLRLRLLILLRRRWRLLMVKMVRINLTH